MRAAWTIAMLPAIASFSHGQSALQVVSRQPSGSTASHGAAAAVTATFNQPMVPLSSPETMGQNCPLVLVPAVKGRCRWQGTHTLSFEPEEALKTATRYRAVLPAGTKSLVTGAALSEEAAWEFETLRPALVDSRPRDQERWVDLKAQFFLQFNLDMDPRRARDSVELEESGLDATTPTGTVAVGLRRASAEEIKAGWPWHYGLAPSTSNVLVAKPARALRPDRAYRLRLKEGLSAAEGELGLAAERAVQVETWYTFRLLEPPAKACLPERFSYTFSNPVKGKDLQAHFTLDPSTPLPQLSPYQAEESGSRDPRRRRVHHYLPDIDWAPDTNYAVKLDAGLTDVFGNKLSGGADFTLATDGYCPSFEMPTGFGVLEGYYPPRHPVTAVNLQTLPLQKALIPDDGFIPFYKGIDWSCDKAQALSAAPATAWDLHGRRNAALSTFIDLSETLAGRKGGFVFTQVQAPHGGGQQCWHKAVDDVTRIGLTYKDSIDSTLVHAAYLKTGAPAKGVPVEIRNGDNRVLWSGVTDAQGFADAPGWKGLGLKDWKRWERPKLWALAKDAGGSAALSMDWAASLSPWRFGVPGDYYPRPQHYRGSLFTDRGVYRPGETVRFKGVLRALRSGDWEPLLADGDPRAVELVVHDPRGAEVLRTTAALSGRSSFDFSYALKDEAPTGQWGLAVTEAGLKVSTETVRAVEEDEEDEGRSYQGREARIQLHRGFRVEAFKPASFEVKVSPSRPSYLAGDEYQASAEGWYLFGAPMSEAPADWTLRLEPSAYEPPGHDGFDFSPGWWQPYKETGRLAGSGKGTLDSKGRLAVEAKLEPGKSLGPMAAVLEAGVMSPERQRLFGRSVSVVHRAELYLGIKPAKGFVSVGEPWRAEIVAVRPGGEPAPGLPAQGKLIRRDWLSVQRAGFAGRLEWVSEQRDTVVSTFAFTTGETAYPWVFVSSQPGQHFLSVAGQDERGRPAEAAVSFYATGKGQAWWSRSDHDLVELVPDKKSYKPGETARILVKSPFARSRAMVTVEREGIHSRRLVTLEGGADTIAVPITDRSVPNVFVGVVLLQGRSAEPGALAEGEDAAKPQAKFGYVGLSVDPGGRRLAVKVATDKDRYRPRQTVKVSLLTTDESGQPAPAEVTVYAVDEGVLALTAYATPDPFSDFYGPRPLLVATADSRLHVIGQRSFGEKGKNRGGGGGRGAELDGVDLRSRFVPTAYWNPSVETGPQGTAEVSFELPDNLSRFRVMAVAHAGRRLGSGDSKLAVAKPLLLRPSLPRLARVGDEFRGGVVVHNNSASSTTVVLQGLVVSKAIACDGEPRRELAVAAGQAVEALWTCRAGRAGGSLFRFKAIAGAEQDGLEWSVPVRLPERLERSATAGVAEPQAIEELLKPVGALSGSSVTVGLSASALSGLQEGARFLLEYPYGCLEQRLSRMMPVITGAELTETFGLGSLGSLKTEVQKSLDKLPEFQHPSGGFGYWPNPWLPDPFITAYALEASALASKEGYRPPAQSVARAVDWLKGNLGNASGWAYPYNESEVYAARAYALYALALHGTKLGGVFQQLYERRGQIPLLAKAYLLKAAPLLVASPEPAKTLAQELLNQSRVAPRSLHFEEPSETRMPWVHGSSVKATAMSLDALLEARGGFPDDQKAVAWLVGERRGGRWRTTQENADVLRALQGFYRRYERDAPEFTGQLTVEGSPEAKPLWSERFSGRDLKTRTREFAPEALFTGDKARLVLSKAGTGRLYYSLGMAYALPTFDKPAAEGLEVERRIEALRKGGGTLRAGERAVVTLTVRTAQDRTFVVLDDPLPAGLEIVDPTFAVEGREDARLLSEKGARGQGWGSFHRSEKYDDRIVIFADLLAAGEHRYSYLVQATTPGRFHGPAAWVEQMYEPEVFGRTASTVLEIVK